MTVFDPGARLVFTQGLTVRPFCTAFLASRPAATMTEGLEVLVHEVIAAMTTEPWPTLKESLPMLTGTSVPRGAGVLPFLSFSLRNSGRPAVQEDLTLSKLMRSWGRLGPAKLGFILPRSNSSVSLNKGSLLSSRQSPCWRQ